MTGVLVDKERLIIKMGHFEQMKTELERIVRQALGIKPRADHGATIYLKMDEINRIADLIGLPRDFMLRNNLPADDPPPSAPPGD